MCMGVGVGVCRCGCVCEWLCGWVCGWVGTSEKDILKDGGLGPCWEMSVWVVANQIFKYVKKSYFCWADHSD